MGVSRAAFVCSQLLPRIFFALFAHQAGEQVPAFARDKLEHRYTINIKAHC
jgi:hypothetical protein